MQLGGQGTRSGAAGTGGRKYLFVCQVLGVGPDVDLQAPIQRPAGRDPVQVERGIHSVEVPGELLSFATIFTISPRSTVIHRVLGSMEIVRWAADACAGLPSMSASVTLAVTARLAAERVSAATTGINSFMAFPLQ